MKLKTPMAVFCRLLLALSIAVIPNSQAIAELGAEAAVKTAFLFNFFKFIEWPNIINQDSYQLCTTLNDHLGDSLLVLENKAINNKRLVIHREIGGAELKNCNIVFIGNSEQTLAVINELKGLPIVTVSDQLGFTGQGGIIGLVQEGNRLTFEINLELANAEGIHISAKLLKLAKTVNAAK